MQTKFFMIGHMPEWLMWTRVIGLGIISMLLIVGAWTQAVAIVSSFAMLKYGIAGRPHPGLLPLPTSTYYLLAIIAFALVGTGSGAFSLDLPL